MPSTATRPPSREATAPGAHSNSRRAPLSRKALIIGAIAIFVIGALAVAAFLFMKRENKSTATQHAPVLTVSVVKPVFQPIEREIAVNGSISDWDPISVGAETSGLKVQAILVDEGAKVTQGQVLAQLDSSVVKPQLAAEEARLRSAIAQAAKAVQPNRQEEINELAAAAMQAKANLMEQEAALVQAKANQENANKNVARYILLAKEGAVSLQDLETRQTNDKVYAAALSSAEEHVKAARFSLTQAQERLSMANTGGRAEDIQTARANVDEIKANVERLKAQLAQTVVRSPVHGLVTRRDVHLGDISSLGKTMFLISRESRLELRAQVPEADLSLVKPGNTVTLYSAIANSQPIVGKVREISPLIDSQTRLATVRIDLPPCSLKSGMYGQGRIQVGKHTALTIPFNCMVYHDDKPSIFIVEGGRVHLRTIEIGTRCGDIVEVKSGLGNSANSSNELETQVVEAGAGFLKDGDYVTVGK